MDYDYDKEYSDDEEDFQFESESETPEMNQLADIPAELQLDQMIQQYNDVIEFQHADNQIDNISYALEKKLIEYKQLIQTKRFNFTDSEDKERIDLIDKKKSEL